jgi:hypothetical protein
MRDPKFTAEAVEIARAILDGTTNPNRGCTLIASLCVRDGLCDELMDFYCLDHDQYGHEEWGFTAENTVPDILEACRRLVAKPPNYRLERP